MATASTSSATPEAAQDALNKTKQALQQIGLKLKPFLQQINSSRNDSRNKRRRTAQTTSTALAHSAVALSLGTLQVIGSRLRGKESSNQANDPLRLQLNQCRSILVQLQQKQEVETQERREKQQQQEQAKEQEPAPTATEPKPLSGSKRRISLKPEAIGDDAKPKASPAKKQKKGR